MYFLFCLLILGDLKLIEQLQVNLEDFDIYSNTTMAQLSDGSIVLSDAQEGHVILLNPDGSFKRKWGGKGQGPNEFALPGNIFWLPKAQKIAVVDIIKKRFSFWDQEGNFIENKVFPAEIMPNTLGFLDENNVFSANRTSLTGNIHKVIHFRLDNGLSKVIWSLDAGAPLGRHVGMSGNRNLILLTPWDNKLSFGVGGHFVALAHGSQNQVHVIDHKGTPLHDITINWPRDVVSEEDINRYINGFSDAVPKQGLRRKLDPPEFWPMIGTVTVDTMDRIWVFGPDQRRPNGKVRCEVYTPEGKLLAHDILSFSPHWVGSGRLFCLTSDETEERFVLQAFSYHLNL